MEEKIGIVGLGYVGLPLAVALGRKFKGTVAYDRNPVRIEALAAGQDCNAEASSEEIRSARLTFSADVKPLAACSFIVIAVPTPVDANNNPDLEPLLSACRAIGPILKSGCVLVFESTVYPGVTEELCAAVLAESSGLRPGEGFHLAYSPERINPGDRIHSLEKVVKIISADSPGTLRRVRSVYSAIIEAGLFEASSIKVAEAAKVIENTQRDLNIALMNELAIIFNRLGISTREVLEAAATKWNFLPFVPGLVGGHCIGVDPYYLTTLAERLAYHPEVILAGRRINDSMGRYIAQQTVKLLVNAGFAVRGARVAVLGISFKEDVSDIRNSRVPDIIRELNEFGICAMVHDPLAEAHAVFDEYGVTLTELQDLKDLDALILAVPHKAYRQLDRKDFIHRLKPRGVLVDVKWMLRREDVPEGYHYWSL